MKIYGYEIGSSNLEEGIPSALAEITLIADSNELRMIAEFISNAADTMDKMDSTYDHEHLSDANHYFENSPHFVVTKP
jgi:hypothetical protein